MIVSTNLTKAQREAVNLNADRIFLTASAGSGKTEVLIRRIIRILNDSEGDSFRLLAVSFTVKAAEELRQRIDTHIGSEAWRVDAQTIHSFALEWIKQFGQDVGVSPDVEVFSDHADRAELLRSCFESLYAPVPSDRQIKNLLGLIDRYRTDLEEVPEKPVPESGITFREVYDAYDNALEQSGALDYPGMLVRLIELVKRVPRVSHRFRRVYKHVLVDEAQDLTKAQSELLKSLIGDETAVFLVGDPNQSIHGWAGGSIQWARHLIGPRAVDLVLNHNFRCATRILEASSLVATKLASRSIIPKPPAGTPPGIIGVLSGLTERDEARNVADWVDMLLTQGLDPNSVVEGESTEVSAEEIAIIGRTRFALSGIESELRRRDIAISVISDYNNLLISSEARLLHALLSLKDNPNDKSASRRVDEELAGLLPDRLNHTAPGNAGSVYDRLRDSVRDSDLSPMVDAVTNFGGNGDELDSLLDRIESSIFRSSEWMMDIERVKNWWSDYRALTRTHERSLHGFLQHLYRVQRTRPDDPGVRLLTAHRAKGLEFKAVAIVGVAEGIFPDYRSTNSSAELTEERRAYYVAMTRARRALLLTWPRTRTSRYGRQLQMEPSRFLLEAGLLTN